MAKKLDFDNPLFQDTPKKTGPKRKDLVRHGAQKGLHD